MRDDIVTRSTPNYALLSLRYLGVLTAIGALSVLVFWISYNVTMAQQADGKLINISAQQRTLSLGTVLHATQLLTADNAALHNEIRARMETDLDKLEVTHNALAYGFMNDGTDVESPPAVEIIFFGGAENLDRTMRKFIEYAYILMDMDVGDMGAGDEHLSAMQALRAEMDRRLDDVVGAYQRETEQKIARLKAIQVSGLFAIIGLLVLSALIVFRPMVRKIKDSFQALFSAHEQLNNHNVEMELSKDMYESQGMTLVALSEDLAVAHNNAEQARRAMGEFMSSMSHELRTPLNAIIGFSQLMEMDKKNLIPSQEEGLAIIHKSGDHLLTLINELLDLSKLEAGAIQLDVEPFAPHDIINDCLRLVEIQAQGAGITVEDLTRDAELPIINADVVRFKQVLLNLLSNAIKYNRPDGQVRLEFYDEGALLRLSVSDTGIGLMPEQVQKLFTPFSRLGAEKTNIEGTGLGLVITKKLVEAMGGQITVDSTVDVGSTFSITFEKVKMSGVEEQSADVDSISAMGQKQTLVDL